MDTPELLLDKGNRRSLGTSRISGGDVINVMCTPPSSKSLSSPSTTPQMRKKTFVAEESPSQSYDYSSPSRLSQEFDAGDVGWEWGDKTSHSRKTREVQRVKEADEEKSRRQRYLGNRMKRAKHKQVREENRRNDQNKGFYKFKLEVEQFLQKSLTDDHSSKVSSKSAPEKEDKTKDLNERTYFLSDTNNQKKIDLNFENSPSTAKENQSLPGNLLDNSEIDALLLEASQSAEEHLDKIKTDITENSNKGVPPKAAEVADNEINSDGDSVDEVLLSICDDELMQLTYTGKSSTTQKSKTSFSRFNSMPPQPQERMTTSSTTKSFIRHSSMPPDNVQNSSGLGTGTTGTSKSDDKKRICTKEEVEKKKLEAKKRQLLSQQRRLLLNSKNKALVLR